MKQLLLIITLLFTGVSTFGQAPELLDNSWYLEELIIDGETIIPPYLINEPKVGRIYFELEGVGIEFCNYLGCEVSYGSGNNIFTLG